MAKSSPTHNQRVLVLINRRSGTVRTRGPEAVRALIKEKLSVVFRHLDVELADGDVAGRARQAVEVGSHDIIIAGGGDGSITSVASMLAGQDVTLGALPLGTMNLIVQALGFSPKLEEALDQFAKAKPAQIDVGMANDRLFMHQVSFGLQPRMARLREKLGYRSRAGKMLGAARALALLAMRPKLVRVNVLLDGEKVRVSSPMLVITNNPIGSDRHWSVQHRLDGGKLGYYVLSDYSLRTLILLARSYLKNRLHDDEIVENRTVQKLLLKRRPKSFGRSYNRYKMRKGIISSMDGEVVVLKNPVSVRILPKSLSVLALTQPD